MLRRLCLAIALVAAVALGGASGVADAMTAVVCKPQTRLFSGNGTRYGSGFFVLPDTVFTAAHVVRNHAQVYVGVSGNVEEADVIHLDAARDIAILRTRTLRANHYLTLSKSVPAPGTRVITYGDFRGLNLSAGTIESAPGIIKAMPDASGFIWSTCPARRGYSGGPLIDAATGLVVGIHAMGNELIKNQSGAASTAHLPY